MKLLQNPWPEVAMAQVASEKKIFLQGSRNESSKTAIQTIPIVFLNPLLNIQ